MDLPQIVEGRGECGDSGGVDAVVVRDEQNGHSDGPGLECSRRNVHVLKNFAYFALEVILVLVGCGEASRSRGLSGAFVCYHPLFVWRGPPSHPLTGPTPSGQTVVVRAPWDRRRRTLTKVEHRLGELFPRVGFIVTTLTATNRAVVRMYSWRGTAEQWIKEGKATTTLECPAAGRELLDANSLSPDSRAHPTTRMVSDVIEGTTQMERRIDASASVPAEGGHGRKPGEDVESATLAPRERAVSPAANGQDRR